MRVRGRVRVPLVVEGVRTTSFPVARRARMEPPFPPVPPPPPPLQPPAYDPRVDILKRELVLAEVHIARLQRKLEAARSDNNMLNDLVETFAALFAKRRKPSEGRV